MLTTSTSVGIGLGLGLFGILSIIRLRSDMITQEEIAYYFVSLALGLLAGVAGGPPALVPFLIGLLVVVMFVADHRNHLGIDMRHFIVQELDFVRDLTVVDIRYRARTSLVPLPRQEQSPVSVPAFSTGVTNSLVGPGLTTEPR